MFDLPTGERLKEVVDSAIIIDILQAAQPRQLQWCASPPITRPRKRRFPTVLQQYTVVVHRTDVMRPKQNKTTHNPAINNVVSNKHKSVIDPAGCQENLLNSGPAIEYTVHGSVSYSCAHNFPLFLRGAVKVLSIQIMCIPRYLPPDTLLFQMSRVKWRIGRGVAFPSSSSFYLHGHLYMSTGIWRDFKIFCSHLQNYTVRISWYMFIFFIHWYYYYVVQYKTLLEKDQQPPLPRTILSITFFVTVCIPRSSTLLSVS